MRTMKVGVVVLLAAIAVAGCQSPTEPEDTIVVDDFVDGSQSPNPAPAQAGDGRTYEKPQSEAPSLFLPYDWKVRFNVTLSVNGTATDDDLNLTFPIEITSVSISVQQCSGGIVVPPSGDAIYATHDVVAATGNTFAAVNASNSLTMDVWYDLPNNRSEACIDVAVGLKWDNENDVTVTATKAVRIRVS